jgi:hypothetical protein
LVGVPVKLRAVECKGRPKVFRRDIRSEDQNPEILCWVPALMIL